MMDKATIVVTPEALKQLANLPRVIRERIGKLFERLEAWPAVSGAKPLTGNLAGYIDAGAIWADRRVSGGRRRLVKQCAPKLRPDIRRETDGIFQPQLLDSSLA